MPKNNKTLERCEICKYWEDGVVFKGWCSFLEETTYNSNWCEQWERKQEKP